jgi:hypothetical protein
MQISNGASRPHELSNGLTMDLSSVIASLFNG